MQALNVYCWMFTVELCSCMRLYKVSVSVNRITMRIFRLLAIVETLEVYCEMASLFIN